MRQVCEKVSHQQLFAVLAKKAPGFGAIQAGITGTAASPAKASGSRVRPLWRSAHPDSVDRAASVRRRDAHTRRSNPNPRRDAYTRRPRARVTARTVVRRATPA